MNVRVRYAPSPTGLQHIGSVRTALFNYLFARSQGGTFILRIEDTDRDRYREDALKDIYETFDWLGFRWDEGPDVGGQLGPYFQSQRKELYKKHSENLIENGHAYRCYCSPQRLENLRKHQVEKKLPQGYDRHCRGLSSEEREEKEHEGLTSVVRLKIPLSGSTTFHDELLGDIERSNLDINPDPVLLKSDGFPTYHLANVVDDHLMQITHIMRAQEWIPTVSVHVLLYESFKWTPPAFCHLPMVLGGDGQKLSKRHGATSIVEFRKEGYLPESILNYISLLGWSYDDTREFFTLGELEKLFSLEKLNKAPATFDYKKLEWFNGAYIRKRPDNELVSLLEPYLVEASLVKNPVEESEKRILEACVPLVKERLKTLSEAPSLVRFLLEEIESYDKQILIPKRLDEAKTQTVLSKLYGSMDVFETASDEENEKRFRDLAESLGIKLGDLLMPLRVALTGSRVSLPLFESVRLLGVERTKERIQTALDILKA